MTDPMATETMEQPDVLGPHEDKSISRRIEEARSRVAGRLEPKEIPEQDKTAIENVFTGATQTAIKGLAQIKANGGYLKDTVRGVTEVPLQIVGGVVDAINTSRDALGDIGNFLADMIPGMEMSEEEAAEMATKSGKTPEEMKTEFENAPTPIPTTKKAESATGDMVRSATTFVTDFVMLGKMAPGSVAGEGASVATRIGKDALRGAAADFVGPEYETRVATLVKSYTEDKPGLQNAVIDYLAGDEGDSGLERRVKNSLEGLALGPLTDGVFEVFKAAKRTKIINRTLDKIYGTGHSSYALDPEIKFDELDATGAAPSIAVDYPIIKGAPELKDIETEVIQATPYPRITRNSSAETAQELLTRTEKDYAHDEQLIFRAIFPEDLKFREGHLQANPKGHKTEAGENVVATWWTSSLEDAKRIAEHKGASGAGSKAQIVAMRASDLPGRVYVQNVTPLGDASWTWVGVPSDVPQSKLFNVDISKETDTVAAKGGARGTKTKPDMEGLGEGKGVAGVSTDAEGGAGRAQKQTPEGTDIAPDDGGYGGLNLTPVGKPDHIEINFSRIEAQDDIKTLMQEMADSKAGEIRGAQRGTRTWQQTKLSAEQEDAWKILSERRSGEPLNAEQSLAVRELWVRSSATLKGLADEAAKNPSEANLFKFRKMAATHAAIQREVIAARTETARALNAWKIPAGGSSEQMRHINAVLDATGGAETTRKMAERYSLMVESGFAAEADKFIEKSWMAKTSDAVAQVWVNSLLSGPKTLARNLISQTAVIGQMLYERKTAELVGQALGTDGVAKGEATAMMFGLVQGIKDSFRVTSKGRTMAATAAKKIVKGDRKGAKAALEGFSEESGTVIRSAITGESGIGMGKVDLPQSGALSAEVLGVADGPLAKGLDVLDTVSQLPSRALTVSDEFYKTATYRMELNAQALRQATSEINAGTLPKEKLNDRIVELINDPPENLRVASADQALIATFTNPVGPFGKKMSDLIRQVPVLGRLIMPFKRTPMNIAAYTFERTPLAPLVANWKADMAAGGARRELAIARTATGSMILLACADMAMSGHITGEGPVNRGQKENMTRQGVQFNSIKVPTEDGGHRYFSYRGLEPLSTSLGIAANLVEILEQQNPGDDNAQVDELVIAATLAIANNVTSQTYMQGVSNFFDAMSDPQRFGESYFQKLAGSVVPSGVSEIAGFKDPYLRAASDMVDAIKRRTPGLSESLPYVRDLWGRPIEKRSGLGPAYDAISPIYSRKFNPEPIDRELQKQEIFVSRPSKKVVFDGVVVDLDRYPEVYDRYAELAGNEMTKSQYGAPVDVSGKGLKDALNDLVTGEHALSPIYNLYTDGPDGGKNDMIQKMVRDYRNAAKQLILAEFPAIKGEVEIRRASQPGKINLNQ